LRETLLSRTDVADGLAGQGLYDNAEAEYRVVLAIQQRVFGDEDSITLLSRLNIAEVLSLRGQHDEAEAELEALIPTCRRVLGTNHPLTLAARHSFAEALAGRGSHDQRKPSSGQCWTPGSKPSAQSTPTH
jgi:hypothetical protein